MSLEPVNISELKHRELKSEKTGEEYSRSADLSTLLGLKDLFIHHELIPPGHRSSAPHAHTLREEMIYVLVGTVSAHLGEKIFSLTVGESIAFPPGVENMHFIQNEGEVTAEVLVVASNTSLDEVIYE